MDKKEIWKQARYNGQPLLLKCKKCETETKHTFYKSFERNRRIWHISLMERNGFSQHYSFWDCNICGNKTQISDELEYGATL